MKRAILVVGLGLAVVTSLRAAPPQEPQQTPAAPGAAKPAPDADEGIPVTNQTVKTACGDCHAEDD